MGRLRDWLRGMTPAPAPTQRKATTRAFDAVAPSRTGGWARSNYDANNEIAQGLDELRKSSRDLVRNNPWAARIVEALVNAIVADGIRPTVATGDAALDAMVYDMWDRWGRQPVAGSRMSIYGWQRLMCRAWLADGEGLTRLRPRFIQDMPGIPPLKLQPMESDLIPTLMTRAVDTGINRIYSGIEYDALGEIAGYHLMKEHPGAMGPWASTWETTRVEASAMLHCVDQQRPGQVRGVPVLTPVVLALWDLAGYQDAVRVAARAAACMVATVSGGNPDESPSPDGINVQGDDEDPAVPVTDASGAPINALSPGQIIVAADGKTIAIHSPTAPQGVSDIVSDSLHAIAAGVGLSYHVLSGDMSDSSFAQAKLGLIEQAKQISARRRAVFVPCALDPLWTAWVSTAISAGLLPNRAALYNVRWSDPRQQAADRLDEVKAATAEVRNGFRSLREVIESDYGRDPDDVLVEISIERQVLRDTGVALDSNPDDTTNSGGPRFANPPTPPAV